MSNAKQETIADIVKEMRTLGRLDEKSTDKIPRTLQALGLRTYADRIEAAAKREREAGAEAAQICGEIGEAVGREATREKSSQVGNSAKMREALEKIASMGEQIDHQLGSSEETVYAFRHERCLAHNISECARAVLAAPPRNCDVGTPDEHLVRHRKWCWEHDCKHTDSCKLCVARWAQMPYEEGGAK